jgi:hypothetical protein
MWSTDRRSFFASDPSSDTAAVSPQLMSLEAVWLQQGDGRRRADPRLVAVGQVLEALGPRSFEREALRIDEVGAKRLKLQPFHVAAC